MFIDASALTSLIVNEADARTLAGKLATSDSKASTSPVAIYETALAVARIFKSSVQDALRDVDDFLTAGHIDVVAIDAEIAALALDAHTRYGKGTGHPAQLNMGDCFAYACAKAHGVPLLYKGDDFVHTDLA